MFRTVSHWGKSAKQCRLRKSRDAVPVPEQEQLTKGSQGNATCGTTQGRPLLQCATQFLHAAVFVTCQVCAFSCVTSNRYGTRSRDANNSTTRYMVCLEQFACQFRGRAAPRTGRTQGAAPCRGGSTASRTRRPPATPQAVGGFGTFGGCPEGSVEKGRIAVLRRLLRRPV